MERWRGAGTRISADAPPTYPLAFFHGDGGYSAVWALR